MLEKEKIANTIENFPEGKWVYAEPDQTPPKGKLWLDGARKEDRTRRWRQIIEENGLEVHTEEGLESLERQKDGGFIARTSKREYRARRVVLATGQRGNPRKLNVPGEDREQVYHRLYRPRHYKNEDIVVIGGGNSAAEAAVTLAEQNRVKLVHRGDDLSLVFQDNRRKLEEAVAEGRVEKIFRANAVEFTDREVKLRIDGQKEPRSVPYNHAFVLVGAQLPGAFLKSLGIRLENEWTGNPLRAVLLSLAVLAGLWVAGGQASLVAPAWLGAALAGAGLAALVGFGLRGDRWAWLGVSFLIADTIYGAKLGAGMELWPYRGWGFRALSFLDRPWSFWYTVLYTLVGIDVMSFAIKQQVLDNSKQLLHRVRNLRVRLPHGRSLFRVGAGEPPADPDSTGWIGLR